MANTYDRGDVVKCTSTITNAPGSPVDPDSVKFRLRSLRKAYTIYTYGVDAKLIILSTGVYFVAVAPTNEGDYFYCFEGTVANRGGSTFAVRKTAFYRCDGTLNT